MRNRLDTVQQRSLGSSQIAAVEQDPARRVGDLQREVATLEEMRTILARIQHRMLRRLAIPDERW